MATETTLRFGPRADGGGPSDSPVGYMAKQAGPLFLEFLSFDRKRAPTDADPAVGTTLRVLWERTDLAGLGYTPVTVNTLGTVVPVIKEELVASGISNDFLELTGRDLAKEDYPPWPTNADTLAWKSARNHDYEILAVGGPNLSVDKCLAPDGLHKSNNHVVLNDSDGIKLVREELFKLGFRTYDRTRRTALHTRPLASEPVDVAM